MSLPLFKSIIDQLSVITPKRVVLLHGFGESLTHPELIKMIKYAAEKGVNTGLSLNPYMLHKKLAEELVDSGISNLLFSLDGHDDISFEKIRGVSNAYDKSVDRLNYFLNLKVERERKMQVVVSMIDFPSNRDSIKAKASDWDNTPGVDRFRSKQFSTWDGSADDVSALSETSAEEFTECIDPFQYVTVLFDGRVVPCCRDYDGKYLLGDANEKTLQEIWDDAPMQQLREEFISRNITNPLCKTCEKRPR